MCVARETHYAWKTSNCGLSGLLLSTVSTQGCRHRSWPQTPIKPINNLAGGLQDRNCLPFGPSRTASLVPQLPIP